MTAKFTVYFIELTFGNSPIFVHIFFIIVCIDNMITENNYNGF